MPRPCLVVARYDEDLTWLDSLWVFDTVVYDKSGGLVSPTNIRLPNVGRESHSYLTYITDRYQTLPEWTVFSQGNPFSHCPDFLTLVRQAPAKPFVGLGNRLTYRLGELDHLDGGVRRRVCSLVWPLIGKGPIATLYPYVWGAQMFVHREAIRRRPRRFYRALLDWHGNESLKMPWGLEVCWEHIFLTRFNMLL